MPVDSMFCLDRGTSPETPAENMSPSLQESKGLLLDEFVLDEAPLRLLVPSASWKVTLENTTTSSEPSDADECDELAVAHKKTSDPCEMSSQDPSHDFLVNGAMKSIWIPSQPIPPVAE